MSIRIRVLGLEDIHEVRNALIAQGWQCTAVRDSIESWFFDATPPSVELEDVPNEYRVGLHGQTCRTCVHEELSLVEMPCKDCVATRDIRDPRHAWKPLEGGKA